MGALAASLIWFGFCLITIGAVAMFLGYALLYVVRGGFW
jgi:hypothetical protein